MGSGGEGENPGAAGDPIPGRVDIRVGTWKIRVGTSVSVAHFLPDFHGADGRVHGHDLKIGAVFSTLLLDNRGMVANPRDLLRLLNAAIADFHMVVLNDVPSLLLPPTLENLAAEIWNRIAGYLLESPGIRFKLEEISVADNVSEVLYS
jgi:6-pyruvoyl-tetrahydropterin synthase